jgi:hypothetical protein
MKTWEKWGCASGGFVLVRFLLLPFFQLPGWLKIVADVLIVVLAILLVRAIACDKSCADADDAPKRNGTGAKVDERV